MEFFQIRPDFVYNMVVFRGPSPETRGFFALGPKTVTGSGPASTLNNKTPFFFYYADIAMAPTIGGWHAELVAWRRGTGP